PLELTGPLPSTGSVDAGGALSFTAGAQGGDPPYRSTWSATDGGRCRAVTSGAENCTFPDPGEASVIVVFSDRNLIDVAGSAEITVFPPLTAELAAGVGGTHLTVGSFLNLTATVGGGSGRFVLVWTGLPPGCGVPLAANLSCHPSAPGTYPVGVRATDSDGGEANASLSVTVAPLPNVAPASAFPWASVLLLLGAVVVAVALLAVVIARRRRRTEPPDAPESGTEPSEPGDDRNSPEAMAEAPGAEAPEPAPTAPNPPGPGEPESGEPDDAPG
ncbi:MAG: hypothetical protein ACREC5_03950, partial [Thermoplasmata archaeon]